MKRLFPLLPVPSGNRAGTFLLPLLLLAALFIPGGIRAQVANYGFVQSTGTYTPISGGTVLGTASNDDQVFNNNTSGASGPVTSTGFPIGFNFVYNGNTVDHFAVSSNGYIVVGTGSFAIGNSTTTVISSTAANLANVIVGFNTDLIGATGAELSYLTSGTAPNRQLTIQWSGYQRYVSGGNQGNINFQIVLNETSNQIDVNFGSFVGPTSSFSAQVGLKGATASDFNSRTSTTSWSATTVSATNSATVSFTSSVFPSSGLTFSWIAPLPCILPSAQPTALVLTPASTSIAGSFTAASPASDRYLVIRTTGAAPTNPVDGVVYTTGAGLGGTIVQAGPATTFNNTGLTANTSYTYYVFAYNSQCSGGPLYNVTSPLVLSATTCAAVPGSLAAAGVGPNGATLSWSSGFGGGANPVTYSLEVATDAAFTAPIAGSPFSISHPTLDQPLTGLTPNTTYYYRVTAGNGCNSAASSTANFTTGQIPVTVFPYTEGFESGLIDWGLVQNGQTNKWSSGTATSNGGAQAAYISNDNGATNTYSTGSTSVSHIYRDFSIPAGFPAINLSFDWKGDGENNWDYLSVWLVPTSYMPTAGTSLSTTGTAPTGRVRLGGNFQDITAYQTANLTIPPAYAGQSFRLVFQWQNDGGTGTQPPAAIDNIVVSVASCLAPSALAADSITPGSAKLSWTENGTATTWNIEYGVQGFTPGTGTVINGVTNPRVITGLNPSTQYSYYVQADCGGNQSIWVGPFNFSTRCLPIAMASTTPAARCGTGTVTLGATPASPATIAWFSSATGGSPIDTGYSFTTPVLNATTTYYAEVQDLSGLAFNVGLPNNVSSLSYNNTTNWGLTFSATEACRINSVAVYPQAAGTIVISVQSAVASPTVFGTASYTFTAAQVGTKVIIPLNIIVPTAGTGYKMLLQSLGTVGGLHRELSGLTYPYTVAGSPVSITSAEWGGITTGYYYYFYDWSVESICVGSPRTAVTATVNTAPAITIAVSDSSLCEGTSGTISVSSPNSGYSYVWMPGNLSGASQTITPTATTTYTVSATDNSGGANTGCTNIDSVQIVFKPRPAAPVVTPANPSVCIGGVSQVMKADLYTVYTNPSGTGTAQSEASSTAGALGPNPLQCYYGGTKQQMLFLASELQSMGLTAGAPIYSLTLALSQANTTYALQNLRIKMGHTSNTTMTTTFVTGLTTVRNPASYTPANGQNVFTFDVPFTWNGTDNLVVEINYSNNNGGSGGPYNRAYYTTTAFQSTAFYRVDNTTANTVNNTTTAGYTYTQRNNISFGMSPASVQWSPATDLYTDASASTAYVAGSSQDSMYFAGAATQSYTLTRVVAGCASLPGTVTVTVNPLPVVDAGVDTAVCTGSQLTLSGSGAANYSWDNGVSDGVAFTASATTTYTVTGTDANNCQNTDQVTVTVNTLPVVSAGLDTTVCEGTSVTLSGSGAGSYSWDNGVNDGVAFAATATTTYTVTGTDANNCQNTDQVTISVNTLPLVNAGADQTVCAGVPVTLSGSGADSYSWDNGVNDGVAFAATATTTYTLTGTDANNCQNSDQVTVTVNANPVVNLGADVSTTNASETLTAPAGFASYLWNTGAVTETLVVSTSGTYSVEVTDGNGCIGSDTIVFVTTFSVENGDGSTGLVSVFPNPTSGIVHVRMEGVKAGSVQLDVISTSGAVLKREVVYPSAGTAQHVLQLDSFAEGVYLIRLQAAGHTTIHRIVVSK